MLRYHLFGGDDYYPAGGWGDYQGTYHSQKEALEQAANGRWDWWHIVDGETNQVILRKKGTGITLGVSGKTDRVALDLVWDGLGAYEFADDPALMEFDEVIEVHAGPLTSGAESGAAVVVTIPLEVHTLDKIVEMANSYGGSLASLAPVSALEGKKTRVNRRK